MIAPRNSNDANVRVRDEVLVSGVKTSFENEEKRTMIVETTPAKSPAVKAELEKIRGVTSVQNYNMFY